MNRPSSRSEVTLEENQCLKDRLQDENLVLRGQIDQAIMFEEIVRNKSNLDRRPFVT
jgi:hypothetical protein